MSVASEKQSTTNTESHKRMHESEIETTDSAWKSLYRVGGAAALIVVVLILSEVVSRFQGFGTSNARNFYRIIPGFTWK